MNTTQRCLEVLKVYLGIEVELAPGPNHHGGRLEVVLRTGPVTQLAAELRPQRRLTAEQARHIVLEADDLRRRTLQDLIVLAEHVEEGAADVLRKGGVFYVDALGNAYVRPAKRPVLLDVRKPRIGPARKDEPGRIVEPGGLKVIHEILTLPEGNLPPYRDIAARAGVALGTVAVVVRELERLRFLERTGPETRRVARRGELLEHFVRGYALKLRPACLIGRFRHQNENAEDLAGAWDHGVLMGVPHAFTGGVAAGFLTNHLATDTVELHINRTAANTLIATEKMLRDDAGGNVVLLDYFAPTILDELATKRLGVNLATPLLVYAELLNDGRPREVETAGQILDTYLRRAL